jgi:hypothetical protein
MSSLDPTARGMLHNFVDGTIAAIPQWVSRLRQQIALNKQQGILSEYEYENETVLMIGFIQGIVFSLFHGWYHEHYNNFPDDQQLSEVGKIVGESIPKIKDTVLNMG